MYDNNKITDINFDNSLNLNDYHDNNNLNINVNEFEKSMSLEELKKEFIKFNDNYLDVISMYHNMNERDQKLFILYSIFYFGLYFNIENIENIITNQVLMETRKLVNEFTRYGSHTGCALQCGFSVSGPSIRGVGYNVSGPLESQYCIKNVDVLNIEDIATVANSGYSYKTEEEANFQSLNDQRNQEMAAFNELLSTLINTKNK